MTDDRATASPQGEAQGQDEDDPSLRQAADLMYRHVALGEVVDADNWRRAARVLVAHANDTLRGSTDIPINAAASPRGEAQGQGECGMCGEVHELRMEPHEDPKRPTWECIGSEHPPRALRFAAPRAVAPARRITGETLADAFYTYLMTGSRTTAAVQAVMRDEAKRMANVALAALRGEDS